MASSIDNVKVYVDESTLSKVGDYCYKMGIIIQETLNEYIENMEYLKANGICSGKIAEALEAYIETTKKLKDTASTMGDTYSTLIDEYMDDVERTDQLLY